MVEYAKGVQQRSPGSRVFERTLGLLRPRTTKPQRGFTSGALCRVRCGTPLGFVSTVRAVFPRVRGHTATLGYVVERLWRRNAAKLASRACVR